MIRTIDIQRHIGRKITLSGWLYHIRKLGGVRFLLLRDGWGVAQAVYENESDLAALEGLTAGTVLELQGDVVGVPNVALGAELRAPPIRVITPIRDPRPIALQRRKLNAALPTLLDHAVLANRHPQRQAAFRISAAAMAGFRATLAAEQFTEVQTPKFVASATEGGANVFAVEYFGEQAYLAQSPQFYKQIMVGIFGRVFEVGPVFRAEPSNTSRHLTEYVSLDVEFGFIENHFTVMQMVETVIRGMLTHIDGTCSAECDLLQVETPLIPAEGIPHIHFAAAQQLIFERHGVDVRGEPDLSPQDERWLGAWAQERYGSDFLFVVGYPMGKRPFYTHPDPSRPQYSNSFDLLFRGTELITGGQRLHVYADYLAALENAGLSAEPFQTYLDAFRYGMPPHGGFAIGLERFVMQLLQWPNVRLATLFPRDMTRLAP